MGKCNENENPMTTAKTVGIRNSIATRLLKTVFGFYLIIAVGVTMAHMVIEYSYQKGNIQNDLRDIQRTFEPGISVDLWQLNQESLESVIRGMLEIPTIVGVKIHNESGKDVALGGVVSHNDRIGDIGFHIDISGLVDGAVDFRSGASYQFELFEHSFPIRYTYEGIDRVLGKATIYSSSAVIY